ncbi:hypothetical protein DFH07DRAFT_570158 [Mycena maculata]|uniref:Uncharacterized protein n=1 Tax=Mycena maculata TaxID=230809 RepID=A0AAD7K8J3_9AGAR|nr:hypothetical protein DFH07DRAFT_570158 [Mycena maculata]
MLLLLALAAIYVCLATGESTSPEVPFTFTSASIQGLSRIEMGLIRGVTTALSYVSTIKSYQPPWLAVLQDIPARACESSSGLSLLPKACHVYESALLLCVRSSIGYWLHYIPQLDFLVSPFRSQASFGNIHSCVAVGAMSVLTFSAKLQSVDDRETTKWPPALSRDCSHCHILQLFLCNTSCSSASRILPPPTPLAHSNTWPSILHSHGSFSRSLFTWMT